MNLINVPTFIDALNCYHEDPKKFKNYLDDRRLLVTEKQILKCWLMLRDNHFNEIIKTLIGLNAKYDQIVEAQKNLLMGITLNNKSECQNAIPYLLNSLKVVHQFPLMRQRYLVYYNLFVANLNLKNKAGMDFALRELGKIETQNEFEINGKLLCEMNFCNFCGKYEESNDVMEKLLLRRSSMSENQHIGFEISRFDFFVKIGEWKKCDLVLKEMKKFRKFNFGANYKFMYNLLAHITKNSAIYMYDKDFIDHPILYYQVKVLKALESGDDELAIQYWGKLSQINSDIYKADLNYHGDRCLFSVCLEKYVSPQVFKKEVSLPKHKDEALKLILETSNLPIKKEDIYFKIWGEQIQDKSDLNKLERLVYRLKQKYSLDIQSKKGCYFLASGRKIA